MTQALLNIIDNPQKSGFVSYMDKNIKPQSGNFESIFDNFKNNNLNNFDKPKDAENRLKQTDSGKEIPKSTIQPETSLKEEKISDINNNGGDITDIKDIKNDNDKANAETMLIDEDLEEEQVDIIVTENIIPNFNDDETINEDPTMNNELNTLENPILTAIISSQIHTKLQTVQEDESEDVEQNVANFVKQSAEQAEKTIYKQIENKTSVQNEAAKVISKEEVKKESENIKFQETINKEILEELNVKVVSSTENESSFGDLMQKQTAQEQAVKIMIQGDIKYEPIAESIKTVEVKPAQMSESKILEQITKQLETMYNSSKLNMVLNPDKLGKINLQLMNSKDGLMAQITVATNEARDVLTKNLNILRENLIANGVNLDNITVKLEEMSDKEQTFDWKEQGDNTKHGFKQNNSKKQKNEEKPFEQMMFEIENNDKV